MRSGTVGSILTSVAVLLRSEIEAVDPYQQTVALPPKDVSDVAAAGCRFGEVEFRNRPDRVALHLRVLDLNRQPADALVEPRLVVLLDGLPPR